MVPDAYGSNAYTNFLIKNACLLLRIYAFYWGFTLVCTTAKWYNTLRVCAWKGGTA